MQDGVHREDVSLLGFDRPLYYQRRVDMKVPVHSSFEVLKTVRVGKEGDGERVLFSIFRIQFPREKRPLQHIFENI